MNTPPPGARSFHKTQLIVSIIVAILLTPLNIFVVYTFLQKSAKKCRPINWLFAYLAAWDIAFVIFEGVWNGKQYFYPEPVSEEWCAFGWTLTLRILQLLSECVPAYTTVIIGCIRAKAVRQSTKSRKLRISKGHVIALCVLTLVLGASACPSLILADCLTFVPNATCPIALSPIYGTADMIHAILELSTVNGTLLLCYSYICTQLICNELSIAKLAPNSKNTRPQHHHRRTIVSLAIYALLYTTFVGACHVHILLSHDCFDATDTPGYIEMTVLDASFQIASVGLNPLLLYACNKDLRRSVRVLLRRGQCKGTALSV